MLSIWPLSPSPSKVTVTWVMPAAVSPSKSRSRLAGRSASLRAARSACAAKIAAKSRVEGGKEAAFAFENALRIVKISNNLGDAKSLITHPATTTHQRLTPEARAELGISDGLLRLSVGLEDAEDLAEDVLAALARV